MFSLIWFNVRSSLTKAQIYSHCLKTSQTISCIFLSLWANNSYPNIGTSHKASSIKYYWRWKYLYLIFIILERNIHIYKARSRVFKLMISTKHSLTAHHTVMYISLSVLCWAMYIARKRFHHTVMYISLTVLCWAMYCIMLEKDLHKTF